MLRKPAFWLAVTLAIAFALLAFPFYVIRPFRYQGPNELALALAVLRIRPVIEIVCAAAAIALLLFSWSQSRRPYQRATLALLTLLVVACALLSRVNIYERMFHPIDRSQFAPARASKLDGKEQVIAVRIGNVARAYPIRIMAYHHIVNDTVARVPIVATY